MERFAKQLSNFSRYLLLRKGSILEVWMCLCKGNNEDVIWNNLEAYINPGKSGNFPQMFHLEDMRKICLNCFQLLSYRDFLRFWLNSFSTYMIYWYINICDIHHWRLFEVAIERWAEWDLNPQPLNSVQTL